ncbi:MAG: DNA polymerase III subunit beta [Caldisericia bacterium]
MKLNVKKADVFGAVSAVATVIPRNPSIQLLGNILFEARDGKVFFTGTDMETWVRIEVSAEIIEEGEITVPSRIFTDLISSLPGEDITITLEEGQMKIEAGDSHSTLNCMPSHEYPTIPEITSGESVTLDRDVLLDIVSKVTPSISDRLEDKREQLGALISVEDGDLSLVATDNYRLAICKEPVGTSANISAIVAGTVWKNLFKLVGSGESSEIKLIFTPSQVGFKFGDVELVSRLIDGEFPPYKHVIPTNFDKTAIIPSDEFLAALNRVNIIVKQGNRKVTLAFSENKLVCKGIAPEYGEVEETLEIETGAAELEVSMNLKKLVDGIRCADSPRVQINTNGVMQPILLQPEGSDSFIYVLVTQR